MSLPKKPKEYLPAPWWKTCPRYINEHPEWKRDEHGFPIFHDDGVCSRCKKPAVKFSHPQYQYKYQILGYCEPCVNEVMGGVPSEEDHQRWLELVEQKNPKKKVTLQIQPKLWPEKALIKELEKIVEAL